MTTPAEDSVLAELRKLQAWKVTEAEQAVADALTKFEAETGLRVVSVSLRDSAAIRSMSEPPEDRVGVQLEVALVPFGMPIHRR